MKTILSIFFACFVFISCKTKEDGTNNNNLQENNQLPVIKFAKNTSDTFNVSRDPFFENVYIKGDEIVKQYKKFLVMDSVLINQIKVLRRFSHLYYFSPILKNDSVDIFTVTGGWDYNETIFLVSKINNQLIDIRVIAEQCGDGGDFMGKTAVYKNGVFSSAFENTYSTFTCPMDTTYYNLKGISKISIDNKGKIQEDTVDVKRNFKIIEKNPDC